MITVEDAWCLPPADTANDAVGAVVGAELGPEETVSLEYLDACVESALYEHGFSGEPFEFKIPEQVASARTVAALRRRWEAPVGPRGDRWLVGTFDAFDEATGGPAVQLVFSPSRVIVSEREVRRVPRRVLPAGVPPRTLLIADVPNWAFDSNLIDMIEYLGRDFQFDRFYTEDWWKGARPNWGDYDIIYECFHANPAMGIPLDRALGSLRSQWFDGNTRQPPTAENIARVNRYRAFHVAARRNYDELAPHCPRAVYLTNPVNTRRFPWMAEQRDRIIASWNGNAKHQTAQGLPVKHFHDVIVPACVLASIDLVVAEYGTTEGPWRKRSYAEMPEFYQQANVSLCASAYEAASSSVMEAMASGLAVIATDVGNHRDMQRSQLEHYGDTGILIVDGSIAAFVEALRALTPERAAAMGAINRAEILARWSWAVWQDRYRHFLLRGLT